MKNEIFETNPNLEKVYATSDGEVFYNDNDAKNHAKKLDDKTVETVYNASFMEVIDEENVSDEDKALAEFEAEEKVKAKAKADEDAKAEAEADAKAKADKEAKDKVQAEKEADEKEASLKQDKGSNVEMIGIPTKANGTVNELSDKGLTCKKSKITK